MVPSFMYRDGRLSANAANAATNAAATGLTDEALARMKAINPKLGEIE